MSDENLQEELNQETPPTYIEKVLRPTEIEDLRTLYTTFNEIIYSIYLNNAATLPFFMFNLTEIEIMIILNDKFDAENNRLVDLYLKNYEAEHLGSRLHFEFRYLNDAVDPLNYIEGQKLLNTDDIWKYHFLNNLDPICGEKINSNIDLISLVDEDYIYYLFTDLVGVKRTCTLPSGDLSSYTKFFYPIILTTYILLNDNYNLTENQLYLVDRAYMNALTLSMYNEFKEDFHNLLKKYNIDF